MVRITLNLDEIQAFGSTNFPLGKHRAKLTECNEAESSTGNPMLVWQWEGADDDSAGESIRSWTSLQDHALSGFKVHAEAFGYHGETEVDTDACVGKYAILVVGKRKGRNRDTGDEEERPSVVTVLPDDRPAAARTASSGARRIGGASNGRPAARTVGQRSEELEDLPF